jgi:hypothetical protein
MADTATWIALGVAVYGAGLSTAIAVGQLRQRKREAARGIDVLPRGRMMQGRPVFGVYAYNSESRPVQVVRAGLVGLNGVPIWHGAPHPPQLPALLGVGESVFIPFLDAWLTQVRMSMPHVEYMGVAVEDAGGRVYTSEPGTPPPLHSYA